MPVFRLRNRPLSLALQGALGTTAASLAAVVPSSNGPRFNVALASNGAAATASSTIPGYAASGAINGDRKGLSWGSGGGWNDATGNAFPDTLTVTFQSAQTIDEVRVYTVQDAYQTPSEPTLSDTFTLYGATDFAVYYRDDSLTWVAIPGAAVVGNNKVGNRFLFGAITTTAIRVSVTGGVGGFSRITEVEAWADALNPPNVTPSTAIHDDFIKMGSDSDDGPTKFYANNALLARWENLNGDFLGKNGQQQGGPPYASATVNGGSDNQLLTFDVTQLAQELSVRNVGIYVTGGGCWVASKENPTGPAPELTVVTTSGTFHPELRHDVEFADSSSAAGISENLQCPFILDFSFDGVVGVVTGATLKLFLKRVFGNPALTLNVYKLNPPIIIDSPETQIGGAQAGLRGGYNSEAEFAAAAASIGCIYIPMDAANFNVATWDAHWQHADSRSYELKTWDEYGVAAVRLQSAGWNLPNPGGGQYLANTLSSDQKFVTPQEDGYYNFNVLFDADTELYAPDGGKLAGLGNFEEEADQYFSAKTHYSDASRVNPGVRHLGWYFYNADYQYRFGVVMPDQEANGYIRVGKVARLEVYLKRNTFNAATGAWNRDGIRRLWLNGVLIFEATTDRTTESDAVKLDAILNVVFYGGPDFPLGVFHVEVGPCVFSNQYIGPMKKKVPAWRLAIPNDGKFHEVPGTAPNLFSLDNSNNWNINTFEGHWNGLQTDEVNDVIYNAKAGGHNPFMQQNGVYKQNLRRDQPIWELVRVSTVYPPGDTSIGGNRHFPDGRPVGAHTYYDGHVCIIDGHPKIVFFGADAATPFAGIWPDIDIFDVDTNDWVLGGAATMPFTFNPMFGKPVCKDPRTQKLYAAGPFSSGTILEFDPAILGFHGVTFSFQASVDRGACIDTKRNRMVFCGLGYYPVPTFGVWDFATGTTMSAHTLQGVDVPSVDAHGGYPGFIYCPLIDRYLWLHNGTNDPSTQGVVFLVHPDTWDCVRIDKVPIGQTTTGAPSTELGIMNKVMALPLLKGVAYYPGWNSNMMFRASANI